MIKHTCPPGAENYYCIDEALAALNKPLPEGVVWWRCMLCGYPEPVFKEQLKIVGACCCGGCGQTTLRPIEEYGDKEDDIHSV